MKPTMRWRLLCLSLIGLGWLLSGYLLVRIFLLAKGAGFLIDVCSAVFGASCDRALLSADSWQLGFPLAGWGVVYFASLGFLLALGGKKPFGAALTLTAAGLGASFVLTALMLARSFHSCYFCFAVHAVNAALLAAMVGLLRSVSSPPNPEPLIRHDSLKTWRRLVMGACVLGALVQGSLWWSRAAIAELLLDREALLTAYHASPKHEIPTEPDDPHLGPADAPVHLVVFSSFQCPGCRTIAQLNQALVEEFGDQLCVVYKYYPLSSQCNSKVKYDLQPRACEAAWAAEAAHQQDAFWRYHDRLFDSNLLFEEKTLEEIARAAGLDVERWRSDRDSSQTKAKMQADVAAGIRLDLNETPSLFLNGRRVRALSLPVLKVLIAHELERATHGGNGPTGASISQKNP